MAPKMGMNVLASQKKLVAVLLAVFLSVFAAGCKKKTPIATAPPPPPPPVVQPEKPKPSRPVVAAFEAEPSTIERGQAATLRWSITGDVTEVRIEPGLGTVNASGNRQVFPGNTTTYTLTATGPAGNATAS